MAGDLIGRPYMTFPKMRIRDHLASIDLRMETDRDSLSAKITELAAIPRNMAPLLPLWEKGPGDEGRPAQSRKICCMTTNSLKSIHSASILPSTI